MNYTTAFIGGLMICLQASCTTVSTSETAPSTSTGTVAFLDKDKHTCHVDVQPPGITFIWRFTWHTSPCKNDTARHIEFNGLPSATTILITDRDDCKKESANDSWFWFEFKTTRNPTSTDFIELEYLRTYRPGAIIAPGLQLKDSYVQPGKEIRDRVSCISIKASAAPPTP